MIEDYGENKKIIKNSYVKRKCGSGFLIDSEEYYIGRANAGLLEGQTEKEILYAVADQVRLMGQFF